MKVPIDLLLKNCSPNAPGISLFPVIQQYLSLDFGKIKKRVLQIILQENYPTT